MLKQLVLSLVHRHMPLEDALVLVARELKRFSAGQSTGISQRAAELADDFLAREHLASYSPPASVCHLLFLLSEGKHLYSDELGLLMDYLTMRKEQLQGTWQCPFPSEFSTLGTSFFYKPVCERKPDFSFGEGSVCVHAHVCAFMCVSDTKGTGQHGFLTCTH